MRWGEVTHQIIFVYVCQNKMEEKNDILYRPESVSGVSIHNLQDASTSLNLFAICTDY